MTLGTVHRWSLFAACSLAVLGTASGSALLAATSALLIASMLATVGQLHDPRRGRLRLFVVHGITLVVLLWALSIARTVRLDSVVIIVCLGLFNRFVLRQGLRDDLILLGGSAVILAVATTITPGLAFLPIFVGFVWLSHIALRSAQIVGLAEREPASRRAAVLASLLSRPAPGGHLRVGAVAMVFVFIGYLGLTLFPKHRFAQFLGAGSFMSMPGASDTMALTNNGVGAGSDGTVVLRVSRLGSGNGLLSGMYAKVYSLDAFDGRTWRRDAPPGRFSLTPERDPPNRSSPQRVKVTMNRIVRRRTDHPLVALGREGPRRLGGIGWKARTSLDGTWTVRMPSTALTLTYVVDLGEAAPTPRLPRAAQRALQRRWMALPETLDRRIRDLGHALTDAATTNAEKIRAVLAHFSSGYRYSLDPLPGEAEDPLTRFLFEARQGHCELYAGAVATLLRVAGVPARVATGYYGGWWNSTGQTLEFTEQDAHAWVEAYDPDRGWIWVDATPADLRLRRRAKSWGWIRDLYDSLEALWFTNVVDFDERKRRALLGRFLPSRWLKGGNLGSGMSLGLDSSPGRGNGAAALGGALVAVAAVAGGGLVFWWRRRPRLGARLRAALAPDPDPAIPLGRLLDGVPEGLTTEARSVVDAYHRWRFGVPGPDQRPPGELVRAVDRLARQLRAARRAAPSPDEGRP